MAEKSIKRLIIARFIENLERLTTPQFDSLVRRVERVTDVALAAAITPSIQMSVSDEAPAGQGPEDFIGYEMEFLIAIKINLADATKDRYDAADELVQAVQTRMENDLQLIGGDAALCNTLTYEGEQPFTNEVNGPLGGSMVFYRVKYRRQRGRPDLNY